MNRRGILRFIAGVPLAGIAQEIAKAEDMDSALGNAISSDAITCDFGGSPHDALLHQTVSRLRDQLYSAGEPVMIPASIEGKRSWSQTYKESIARQIRAERKAAFHLIEEIMENRTSSLARLGSIYALSEKLGIKL